jgi:hypothetical protein
MIDKSKYYHQNKDGNQDYHNGYRSLRTALPQTYKRGISILEARYQIMLSSNVPKYASAFSGNFTLLKWLLHRGKKTPADFSSKTTM